MILLCIFCSVFLILSYEFLNVLVFIQHLGSEILFFYEFFLLSLRMEARRVHESLCASMMNTFIGPRWFGLPV